MAVLVPSATFETTGGHDGAESDTLKILQASLPEDLTVYHGLHWTNASRFATRYGEIDFLIIDDAGRIVLIEQKNGLLEEDGDGLYKRYDGTRRKALKAARRRDD